MLATLNLVEKHIANSGYEDILPQFASFSGKYEPVFLWQRTRDISGRPHVIPVATKTSPLTADQFSWTNGKFSILSKYKYRCHNAYSQLIHTGETGWLGWAMVLGSFQCRGVLLLLHIVGQGPAVLAAGAGRVGYILFIFFIYLPFLTSCLLGGGWTWLEYCGFGC